MVRWESSVPGREPVFSGPHPEELGALLHRLVDSLGLIQTQALKRDDDRALFDLAPQDSSAANT